MCNINIAVRLDGQNTRILARWMDIASWNSWINNNDGEGYIRQIKNKTIENGRSNNKIDFSKYKPCKFLASHQRLTTSGQGENNIHPHDSKNFMLMHNGVFSGLGDDKRSDTYYYLQKLEDYYNQSNDVAQAIKDVNAIITGSYSILIYHKEKQEFYYYKNSSTSMFSLKTKDYLFMSTSQNNVFFAKELLNSKQNINKVGNNKIYKITNNGLKQIGKFKEQISTINEWWSGKPKKQFQLHPPTINQEYYEKTEEEKDYRNYMFD